MTKKTLIFVFSLFLIGSVFLFFSKPFIFSYDIRMIIASLIAMVLAQYIEIPIGGVRFTAKPFLYLFLIPFITPETIMFFSLLTTPLTKKTSWQIRFLRLAFEFLQFSVGIFLFRHAVY
ncbi:MAG: GGDEF domain-containing protein, partial [Fervidobacterium pennivorans]